MKRDHPSPDLVIPLSKVSSLLVTRLRAEQMHQLPLPEHLSLGEKVHRCFDQYQALFKENQHLNDELAQVIEDRNRLADKFNAIKRTKSTEEAVKRKRRYARDIERLYHCPIQKCNRGYGSEGSLSHHVRLKHLQFYESGQYEIFIQNYIDELIETKKKEDRNEDSAPSKAARRHKDEVKQEEKEALKREL